MIGMVNTVYNSCTLYEGRCCQCIIVLLFKLALLLVCFPVLLLQDLGVRVLCHVFLCYTVNDGVFYLDMLICIYLGVLQIVGIVLAFQTRSVKINVLNESMFVAALVYSSSIIFTALVIVYYALPSYINVSASLFSGGILLLATISLALTFIPKVRQSQLTTYDVHI